MALDKAAAWLKQALNYEFNDASLLQSALTHRSATGNNNERLEFLGDAVLDTVVSDIVFRLKPEASEGALSRLRSSLVKDVTLAEVAADLGIGEHMTLGPGERKSGGHRRASILADAFEAIIGAVYLDAGYPAAERIVHNAYGDRLSDLPDAEELRDPKTRLQELLQAHRIKLPAYDVVSVSGKAHQQSFNVSCKVDDLALTTKGEGLTRRDAEQEAAREMLPRVADVI